MDVPGKLEPKTLMFEIYGCLENIIDLTKINNKPNILF
jgi:hypothetical protein